MNTATLASTPSGTSVCPARLPNEHGEASTDKRQGREDINQRISQTLKLLDRTLSPQRRLVRPGEVIYRSGQRFQHLYILNAGTFKLLSPSADGREQVVGLKFRGDWMGFAGIAQGIHGCDAVAMDVGEVWVISYESLLKACAVHPELLATIHEAMSGEIMRDRDSLLSVCTLPADARVADFLRYWADSLAERGMRTDQITLRMTRAEIGNYLGMTLETVSRALTKLARADLISFTERDRRQLRIPDLSSLCAFIQGYVNPPMVARTLQ